MRFFMYSLWRILWEREQVLELQRVNDVLCCGRERAKAVHAGVSSELLL